MIGIIFSCDDCWPLHDGNKSKAMVVWWCQWLSQCVSRALVAAHMGMAIQAGTDIAIEAADIVLTKSNLEDILQSSHWPSPARGIHIAAGVALPSTGIQLPSWVAGNSYGSLFYDHVLLLSLHLKLQTAECVLPICIPNQSHDLPYAQVLLPVWGALEHCPKLLDTSEATLPQLSPHIPQGDLMFPQILYRVCAESKLQLLREFWVVGQETGGQTDN